MRHILLIICLLVSPLMYAMSCSNGNIIDKGDTLTEVLNSCGKPISNKSYTKTTEEQWEYINFNQTKTEITIQFVNDQIKNIQIMDGSSTCVTDNTATLDSSSYSKLTNCQPNEVIVSSTAICKQTISIGNSSADVQAACGSPSTTSQKHTVEMRELTYDGSTLNTLIFENNKLVDWK